MLKIAVIGSHGTMKSSASNHIAALLKREFPLKSIKLLEENVREVARFFPNGINTTEFQKFCIVDRIHREFIAEQVYDVIVCDRTPTDTVVYGLSYSIPLPTEYFTIALNHLEDYDIVIFIRPDSKGQEVADDGFRDADRAKRDEVDAEFERLLKMCGGKYIEVRTSEVFTFDYLKALGIK